MKYLWLILFSISMGLFVLYYPYSFNYETDVNCQYWLAYVLPFLPALIIIKNCKIDYAGLQKMPVLCLSMIIMYGLFVFSKNYTFSNEYYFIFFIVFSLFLSGVKLLTVSNLITGFYILIPIYLYELFVGMCQITEDNSLTGDPLALKGTLRNSGIYSCYIVTGLPFLYYFLFRNKWVFRFNSLFFKLLNVFKERLHNYNRILFAGKCLIFICVLFFSTYILFYTQSRTAIVALVVAVIAIIWLEYKSVVMCYFKKLPGWVVAGSALIAIYLVGLAFNNLFYFKKLSAIGRLRGWKITCDHITESFWFGTGLGRFTLYYPQWQAQYFKTQSNPPLEFFLSADESYIIFNEYLQLFKEVGLVGFVIVLLLLIYFLRFRSSKHKHLLNSAKATVISIFACGVTSYPLHCTFFLLIITFCFLVGSISRENCKSEKPLFFICKPLLKTFLLSIVTFSLVASYRGIQKAIAVYEWASLRNNYTLTREELKLKYANIYQSLYFDGKFLTEYGEYLLQNNADCPQAVKILEEAKKYFFTLRTAKATGYAYWQIKNYSKAIEHFEWISCYMPNRFGIKYELLKLYKESADITNAKRIAKVILTMPVKIPSSKVDQIKWNARQMLSSL
jgi:tetratricopeptide (TPR) repeat protein